MAGMVIRDVHGLFGFVVPGAAPRGGTFLVPFSACLRPVLVLLPIWVSGLFPKFVCPSGNPVVAFGFHASSLSCSGTALSCAAPVTLRGLLRTLGVCRCFAELGQKLIGLELFLQGCI